MIRTERRMRLCGVLIAVNLAFIWGNSLLPGEVSGAISDYVKALLSALLPGSGLDSSGGGFLVRKIAHFSEFACLGALLMWRFGMLGRRWPGALALAFAAACVDEGIQIFVPDRGPGLRDVTIDTCGAAFGLTALLLASRSHRPKTQ